MRTIIYLIYSLTIFFTFSSVHSKKVDEQHCEGKPIEFLESIPSLSLLLVCIKMVSTFAEGLPDDDKSSPDKIEKAFKKYCSSKVKVDTKEHRLVNKKIFFREFLSIIFAI